MDDLAQLRLIIDELHGGLEKLPYHVFLGVDEKASGDAVRAAFHDRAARFHPDLFYSSGDEALRAKVYAVYKRMTEAYRVLSNPEQRARYEQQRARGGHRLDATERAPAAKRPEDTIADARAKKYYMMALDAERRGDAKGAKFNLQMAKQLEPDNAAIADKLSKL